MNLRYLVIAGGMLFCGCDRDEETLREDKTNVSKVVQAELKEDEEGSDGEKLGEGPIEGEQSETEASSPRDWKEVIRESEKCVVSLDVESQDGESRGTGFFVGKDGLVATNYHVIEGAGVVKAKNYQGFTLLCRGILAADEDRDLALLKFAAKDLPILKIADEGLPEKGEDILTIGNPMGLDTSVTRGIVSALREGGDTEVIQFDAAVSPGSSGSPVLNREGEVLGVASFDFEGEARAQLCRGR